MSKKWHTPRQRERTIDYGGNACFKNEPSFGRVRRVVFTGNETEAVEGGFVGNVYDLTISLRRKKIKGILIMRSRFHNPFSLHGKKCVADCTNDGENARILYENRDP